MTDASSRAGARFPADPRCVICDGLGVRHVQSQRKAYGRFVVERVECPCTLIGPAVTTEDKILRPLVDHAFGMAARYLSELPPIKELPMDPYPDCQPRTPIDPPTTIKGVVFKGNTDLNPTARVPRLFRECPDCEGRGVMPRSAWAKEPGDRMCNRCQAAGTVRL